VSGQEHVLDRSDASSDLVEQRAARIRFDGDCDDDRRAERFLPDRLTLVGGERGVARQHLAERVARRTGQDEEPPRLGKMMVRRPDSCLQHLLDQVARYRI